MEFISQNWWWMVLILVVIIVALIIVLVLLDVRDKKILKDFKPDIVIGCGGYVSGPIVLQAAKMGIKTAIHEQNAFPGVTNKILAKNVDTVFLATEKAKK